MKQISKGIRYSDSTFVNGNSVSYYDEPKNWDEFKVDAQNTNFSIDSTPPTNGNYEYLSYHPEASALQYGDKIYGNYVNGNFGVFELNSGDPLSDWGYRLPPLSKIVDGEYIYTRQCSKASIKEEETVWNLNLGYANCNSNYTSNSSYHFASDPPTSDKLYRTVKVDNTTGDILWTSPQVGLYGYDKYPGNFLSIDTNRDIIVQVTTVGYISGEGDDIRYIGGLDTTTGDIIWENEYVLDESRGGYNDPCPIDEDRGVVFHVVRDSDEFLHAVQCLDLTDGSLVWNSLEFWDPKIVSMAIDSDKVYIAYTKEYEVGNGGVAAIDKDNGETIWERTNTVDFEPRLLKGAGDQIIVLNGDTPQYINSIDKNTGNKVWSAGSFGNVVKNFFVYNGNVYTSGGDIYKIGQ